MNIIYFGEVEEPYKIISEMKSKAMQLISKYFVDKKDKGGNPYIDHLYYVANCISDEADIKCSDKYSSLGIFYNKAFIVALLHDIVEDTDLTLDDLIEEGIIDKEILDAIDSVTRRPEEQYYFDFIKRVNKNDIGRIVKIYDLENNMDIRRLDNFGDYEKKRLNKYWWSWKFLKGDVSAVIANNNIHKDRLFK